MRWVQKKIIETEWHPWFAWFPVQVPPKWADSRYRYYTFVWLKRIQRRRDSLFWGWEYKEE